MLNKKLSLCLMTACILTQLMLPNLSEARDNFVRDLIQSLSDQTELGTASIDAPNRDQRLASVIPSDKGSDFISSSTDFNSNAPSVPMALNKDLSSNQRDKFYREVLFPGASSVDVWSRSLIKLASLSPSIDPNANTLSVLDSHDNLGSFGKLASEPINLYSNFLIEVNKSNFTVDLSGFKENGEKILLYSCRAGLGSPEYPTPRGTFYILRIFDDKPLWIPPQDREWAAGEVPSRNVYGGHMMPFFSKYSALANRRTEIVIDDEDVVAAPIKMVDAGAYRIHGTNSPWSIGSGQSHGCVRLLNKSVAQLADTLKMYVGTTTRGETANGVYINLAKPVKMVLY